MTAFRAMRSPLLLAVLLASGTLAGCVSAARVLRPQAADRLPRVRTVSLAPPRVAVYEAGPYPRLVTEWTESARTNLAGTLTRHFESAGPLIVQNLDVTRSPAAAQAVEALPLWSVGKYGTIQTVAAGKPALSCVASPVPALAEAADGDAVLLTYAVESIKTPKVMAVGAVAGVVDPSNWLFLPLWLAADPKGWAGYFWGAGHTAVQFCLVDPRTAEVLWSQFEESYAGRVLQNPARVDSLVADAAKKFQQRVAASRKPGV